jgi:hypothetical protein
MVVIFLPWPGLACEIWKKRLVGPHGSKSSRKVEKFNYLRPGQLLSVGKACDKFFESRGLKQVPFRTFLLRKTGNKD